MTQFKKMKMRINNPDHSKAVQEWLFEQGYEWNTGNEVKYASWPYLFTGCFDKNGIAVSNLENTFNTDKREEISVQHLDPHLYIAHKSTCVPAKPFTEKPMKSEFEKLSQQLKHLDKAIDSHENKQNKRKQDRQRIIDKLNGMLPEGYGICLIGGVSEHHESLEESWSREIMEDSVWECTLDRTHHTKGKTYKVLEIDYHGDVWVEDDDDNDCLLRTSFLQDFKRIS